MWGGRNESWKRKREREEEAARRWAHEQSPSSPKSPPVCSDFTYKTQMQIQLLVIPGLGLQSLKQLWGPSELGACGLHWPHGPGYQSKVCTEMSQSFP
jgi:hypothetical protein